MFSKFQQISGCLITNIHEPTGRNLSFVYFGFFKDDDLKNNGSIIQGVRKKRNALSRSKTAF